MAAVPSKHDLASFVRSIHVELALAVPAGSINAGNGSGGLASEAEVAAGGGGSTEADLTLLPPLLEGVVRAAKLFCAKVEAMQSVEEVRARVSYIPPAFCVLVCVVWHAVLFGFVFGVSRFWFFLWLSAS